MNKRILKTMLHSSFNYDVDDNMDRSVNMALQDALGQFENSNERNYELSDICGGLLYDKYDRLLTGFQFNIQNILSFHSTVYEDE